MYSLSVEELVDVENHAWEEVRELLSQGISTYRTITAEPEAAANTLVRLQVSTKSYLGAIAYETGGIVFEHGWISLLGAGGDGIYGSLTSWNGLSGFEDTPALCGMLIVAYDMAGGFFGLDTGRFGQTGHIYYFAPDTLEWESTELTYSGFIGWLAEGDLNLFYETFRWEGWQDAVGNLQPGQVFSYYPPLWTAEGSGELSSKAPIMVTEVWKAASNGS
ncbi:hypothetical protein GCM10010912_10820 [Paenibacillus albidus]|uniref:DUF2625 domain-containing protein n=1 Tax=Paenibacillus albidus TaxID=2041023 RepID=A0A917C1Q0_9BACL|nr:DUF2625 family protein [Paenibacillus albidus]GGF67662.1 hypothetical protein GCM10010912_10820 [Paenibacillus albidus]